MSFVYSQYLIPWYYNAFFDMVRFLVLLFYKHVTMFFLSFFGNIITFFEVPYRVAC